MSISPRSVSGSALVLSFALATAASGAPRLTDTAVDGTVKCQPQGRRALSSYSAAELEAFAKEFADEDRELAALGIAMFAEVEDVD